MRSAATLRTKIEAALADRIPSALTPAAKTVREVVSTGIAAIDAVLDGGLPVGAVTEMIGAECSGRTALALSFLAQLTNAERVCAWVDVSDALSPESAAASGIDLKRLLWVRCGVQPASQLASCTQGDFALPETVVRSKFLLAEGILQNQDGVIHVKATRLTALADSAMELRSHDFH